MARLHITVRGQLGNLSAESFAEIVQKALRVLHGIDLRLTNSRRRTIRWVISGVYEGSVGVVLESRPAAKTILPESERVARLFAQGVSSLGTEAVTPPYFSTQDVLAVQAMVNQIGREGVTGVGIAEEGADGTTTELTRAADLPLRKLTGIAYYSMGSIEGRVEVVSVRKGSRHFNITVDRTLKSVRCTFPPDAEEDVFDAIRPRRRVIVSGRISYNGANEPVSIHISKPMRFLKEVGELPSPASLVGIDPAITEPLSTEDYLRSSRNA